jgi:hypothetical protein
MTASAPMGTGTQRVIATIRPMFLLNRAVALEEP